MASVSFFFETLPPQLSRPLLRHFVAVRLGPGSREREMGKPKKMEQKSPAEVGHPSLPIGVRVSSRI